MPILKVDILGSIIDINYEEEEKEKLLRLINKFNQRLREFPKNVKIHDKTIIFLSALKAEDELEENNKIISGHKIDQNKTQEQFEMILNLNNEIILLKNKIKELVSHNLVETNNNVMMIDKIKDLELMIGSLQIKIINALN